MVNAARGKTSHVHELAMASSGGTTLLPPSSLRDITAIVFILLSLPQLVSCMVFLTYILSGSSKLIGGRLFAKHFLFRKTYKQKPLTLEDTSYNIYASKLFASLFQAFSINSIIILVMYHFFPLQWPKYLSILAKSIIASEMIGSAFKNTTTVTSVSATTATSTTTTTTIKRPASFNFTKHKPASTSSVKYAFMSFVLVLLIRLSVKKCSLALEHSEFYPPIVQTIQHIHSSFLKNHDLLKRSDRLGTFASSVGHLFYWHSGVSNSWGNRLLRFVCTKWFRCDERALNMISKSSRCISTFLNYTYLVLCVHVVTLTISPVFHRIVLLKNYSKTLDDLSSLTPSSEIDFKRNLQLAKTKRPAELDGESVTINVEQPQKSSIQAIRVPETISSSSCPSPGISASVAAKNFETFCMTPFTVTPPSSMVTLKPHRTTSITKVPPPVPNSTTIVDKDLVNVTTNQPFWTLLAATKAIIKRPDFFAGEVTKKKNNGGLFISTLDVSQRIPVAVCYIDSQCVALEVLQRKGLRLPEASRLRAKVNGIAWMRTSAYYGVDETFICIFGLSPLSQYEIEIFEIEDTSLEKLCHVVCSTVSSVSRAVLSQSQETSSFETLQSSLIAAINGLNQLKSDYKKMKRDENKKIADLKKERDYVQSRISKYNQNLLDTKSSGKMKGLQNTVAQFENEVRELNERLSSSNTTQGKTENEFKAEEREYQERIAETNRIVDSYEASLVNLRNTLKAVTLEVQQLESKKQKLANKESARLEEVQKIANDVKVMKKNGILGRLQKRHKKVDEKFEGIMAKIAEASTELEWQLQSIQQ